MTILEHTESLVAGEMLYVNGTLLDDLGMPLYVDGVESVAIVRLFVDGVPVASVQVMLSLVYIQYHISSPNQRLQVHTWLKYDLQVDGMGRSVELAILSIQNFTY